MQTAQERSITEEEYCLLSSVLCNKGNIVCQKYSINLIGNDILCLQRNMQGDASEVSNLFRSIDSAMIHFCDFRKAVLSKRGTDL